MLGRCQEAQEIANDSLRFDSFDSEAIYVRGLCLYFEVIFFFLFKYQMMFESRKSNLQNNNFFLYFLLPSVSCEHFAFG